MEPVFNSFYTVFTTRGNGIASAYRNDARQQHVNSVAEVCLSGNNSLRHCVNNQMFTKFGRSFTKTEPTQKMSEIILLDPKTNIFVKKVFQQNFYMNRSKAIYQCMKMNELWTWV